MSEPIRYRPLISCFEASRLVSLNRDRRLSPYRFVQMHLHLSMCNECTKFHHFVKKMPQLILDSEETEELPAHLRERIKKNLAYLLNSDDSRK